MSNFVTDTIPSVFSFKPWFQTTQKQMSNMEVRPKYKKEIILSCSCKRKYIRMIIIDNYNDNHCN